jgi:hypothetical protein
MNWKPSYDLSDLEQDPLALWTSAYHSQNWTNSDTTLHRLVALVARVQWHDTWKHLAQCPTDGKFSIINDYKSWLGGLSPKWIEG